MPGRKTIWMTDAARIDLRALIARWSLSDSATIARALALAEAGLLGHPNDTTSG